MEYTQAIHFHDGESLTITEEEKNQVEKQILNGAEWIKIQGQLINTKSIKRVGNHHATAQIKRIESYQEETTRKIQQYEQPKLESAEEIRKWVNS